jgi:hypothetical protein
MRWERHLMGMRRSRLSLLCKSSSWFCVGCAHIFRPTVTVSEKEEVNGKANDKKTQ